MQVALAGSLFTDLEVQEFQKKMRITTPYMVKDENEAAVLLNNGKGAEAAEGPTIKESSDQVTSLNELLEGIHQEDVPTTVEELLAGLSLEEVPTEYEIVPNTRGKNEFLPETDPRRPLKIHMPLTGKYAPVACGVTSASVGEGGTVSAKAVEQAFGLNLKTTPHMTQFQLVLSNQQILVGYCKSGNPKPALYFPKKYFPLGFILPPLGYKAKLMVVGITIG